MSFSIYYRAVRSLPLTASENAAYQEIVDKYCADYPFEGPFEELGVY